MTWENVPTLFTAPLHGHRCVIYKGTYGDGRTVQEYDITKNRFKKMGPLPFSKMTMIKWADNFLMIGGLGSKSVLSKVV